MAVKAEPDVIEIGYGENATLEVGMMDVSTGEFENRSLPFYMNARFINFEVLEYPGGNLDGTWVVSFNPSTVQAKPDIEKPLKTKVTISLTAPKDPSHTIQSGILKLKVKDITAYGNLWFPPADWGGTRLTLNSILMKGMWLAGSFIYPGYGKYSGTVDSEKAFNISILIKVKPYHKVRFEASPLKQITPGEIASIPIHIQNLGNYNDTFDFRIAGDHDRIILSNPVSISLKPGEQKDTYLAVAVTPNILDTGTLDTIKIETYSIDQPNVTIAQDTVFLETKGIYISELGGVGFLLFGIIAIIFVAFFFYWRRKILIKSGKKPEKPWDVPEKKQYLEKLKKEDQKKYNAVLKEMNEEYKTSMLSYKSSRETTLKESREKSLKKFTDVFKRPDKEKKVKTKTTEKKKQQVTHVSKVEEIKNKLLKLKSPKKEEQIKSVIDKSAEIEEQRRERAIIKIKKAEEKQRKKFEKLIIE